jgi:predicted adenylyl cyclase CyaB
MSTNIEIKARVRDFADLCKIAERLSDTPVQVIKQVDTFFITSKGRLKLRELQSMPAQLIYYERLDLEGPKRSDYYIFETSDSVTLKQVLGFALGIRGTVRKVRRLYMLGNTRLHLDEVDGLGSFVELEVVLKPDQSEAEGQAIADDLISRLGIDRSDLLQAAYIDLLESSAS